MAEISVPKKFMNGVKKKPQPNITNWQFAARQDCKVVTQVKLPIRCSIKEKFPPVYTQYYGNCTSNAVLACDNYYYHDPKSSWVPSTTFTYYNQRKMDRAGFAEDDGSSVETALNCVRKYGACNSKVWPNTQLFSEKPSKAAYDDGLKGHEVTKYYNVKSLLQIKKALHLGYPVAISMDWAFTNINRSTWVLNDPTDKEIKNCDCGHAVVIVGYDDSTKLVEIRNSWGPSWGNNGYAYITYKTLQKCIWYDDSYAVVK